MACSMIIQDYFIFLYKGGKKILLSENHVPILIGYLQPLIDSEE